MRESALAVCTVCILYGCSSQLTSGPPPCVVSSPASSSVVSRGFYTSPTRVPSRMRYGFLLRYRMVEDTGGIGTGRHQIPKVRCGFGHFLDTEGKGID